jgi:hypothetical protein
MKSMSEAMIFSDRLDQAAAMVASVYKIPIEIQTEDRLRGAMISACMLLRQNAPSRALETLEKELDRK